MKYLDITQIESSQLQDIDRIVALKEDEVKILDKDSITKDTADKVEAHNTSEEAHKELFNSAYNAIESVADKLNTEITDRQTADSDLQSQITAETEARTSADTALRTDVDALKGLPLKKGSGNLSLVVNDTSGNIASEVRATAFGEGNTASGNASFAEGVGNSAQGGACHSEGASTKTAGWASHSEGSETYATYMASHSEGYKTQALHLASHSEGVSTTASGEASHSEGSGSTATGVASHSEGSTTVAAGNYSHSEGQSTTVSSMGGHSQGRYNEDDTNALHTIGIGTSNTARKNSEIVYTSGKKYLYGVGGYDGTKSSIANGAKSIQEVLSSSSGLKYYDITVEYKGEEELKITQPWTLDEIKSLLDSGVQPLLKINITGIIDGTYTIIPNFGSDGYLNQTLFYINNDGSELFLESDDDGTVIYLYRMIGKTRFIVNASVASLPTIDNPVDVTLTYISRNYLEQLFYEGFPVGIELEVKADGTSYNGLFLDIDYCMLVTSDNKECPYRVYWDSANSKYKLSLNYYDNLYVLENSMFTKALGRIGVDERISIHNEDRNAHSNLFTNVWDSIHSLGATIEFFDVVLDELPTYKGTPIQFSSLDRLDIDTAYEDGKLVVIRFYEDGKYFYMVPSRISGGEVDGVFTYNGMNYHLEYVNTWVLSAYPVAPYYETEEWTFTLEDGSTVTKNMCYES